MLMDVSSAVAEIDVLLAWSFVSRDCNLVRAQLTDDFVIIVKVLYSIVFNYIALKLLDKTRLIILL